MTAEAIMIIGSSRDVYGEIYLDPPEYPETSEEEADVPVYQDDEDEEDDE